MRKTAQSKFLRQPWTALRNTTDWFDTPEPVSLQ